jgi:multidrug efflux system outer membrane protein
LPPDLPKVPSGVPGSVLARRPDVAAALDALLAARARVGVAQTSGGPDANLSASTGLASSGLAQLVRMSARTWGLGALMGLPLWDGGRQEAGVQVADADFSAAQAHYRTRFLGALQDVEDQLSALQALDQQATVTARGTDAAAQALERMRARVAHGLASDQELLVATRSALQAQRQQLEVRSEQFQSTVALVRALGGGWE